MNDRPPRLYDLTGLQKDMSRLHGMTAARTLAALQHLYELKLATYPRTDSRHLSTTVTATLGAVVAVELARLGVNKPFAYNRKEAKDHGEGGTLVGAPLKGRVLIVDDVMSAGTAARESIALIKAAGATPHAVAIALDRQEKATENVVDVEHSAVQYVRNQLGMQVCAIAKLADLLLYLSKNGGAEMRVHHERVFAYRQKYGVTEG